MMTNEEIRAALKSRCRIVYDGISYSFAQAWRVSVSPRGEYISSLELIARRKRADGLGYYETAVVAPVEKCEVVLGKERVQNRGTIC